MVGKKNNLQPMWKRWMKQGDLEKRTQSLDQVFLGCTQRECKPYKKLVDEHKNLFGSLTSAGTVEKLPRSGESNARITAWSDENGRPCEEMRRKILRISKEEYRAIIWSLHTLRRQPPAQRRRIRICGRIIKCLLLHRPQMCIFRAHRQT